MDRMSLTLCYTMRFDYTVFVKQYSTRSKFIFTNKYPLTWCIDAVIAAF